MNNNYDRIAPVYDFLSRLVFGRAQVRVQQDLLGYVPSHCRVLIVGGGTGWILESLAERHSQGLDITYLEISEKMLLLSRKREVKQNRLRFIHQAVEEYEPGDERYDVVMTSFLFDNFREEKALKVFQILDRVLMPSGIWLYTDFYLDAERGGTWKRGMMALMYAFFRIVSKVEAKHLPDMEQYFTQQRYEECFRSLRYFRFLKGSVYRKSRVQDKLKKHG